MARKYKKEFQFKTRWFHRKPRYWFQRAIVRPEGVRDFPEVLRLDVKPGHKAEAKPPVRIFLGTEAGQYRAERVFVWSVITARNPARAYEIYFMKNLRGYDRTGWKTGFTNYRYGIPAMAGGTGRAIYNDVDQIYLSDPAELFDLDMGGKGMLCITERETSVMLIDCAKMIKHWTLADAQGGRKHSYFRDVVHDNGLWGELPGEWNARDEEYSADKSKCFHFTTLQTQPWQPFPDILRYGPHPDGEVWFGLERAADKAKFTTFTRAIPSRRYPETIDLYGKADHETKLLMGSRTSASQRETISRLAAGCGARTLLCYGDHSPADWPGLNVSSFDPLASMEAPRFNTAFDLVASVDLLQHVPEEDVCWMLDEMFAACSSDGVVYVSIATDPDVRKVHNGKTAPCTVLPAAWWKGQLVAASSRHPGIKWILSSSPKGGAARASDVSQGGGKIAKAA